RGALESADASETDRRSGALRFMFACFLGSLLIPFTISFLRPEIFLWYRYPVIFYPMFCIALGGIAAMYWGRAVIIVSVATLLGV
ncbi:hypothetical protein NL329_30480, partial [Klebsiella pneumoniae]|nr:hypothetical protein [Klebsiella pneumoniae]